MSHSITLHAMKRIHGRLHMTEEEVVKILDDDLAILIAIDLGALHKLFYSTVDDNFFIAIVNEKTSTIITIKPYQFHLRFEVDPKSLKNAKELALHGKREIPKQKVRSVNDKPSVIHVVLVYRDILNMSRNYKVVKKFQMSEVGSDLAKLSEDENILKQIEVALSQFLKGKHRLLNLYLRIGSKPPNWIIKEIDLRLFSRFC